MKEIVKTMGLVGCGPMAMQIVAQKMNVGARVLGFDTNPDTSLGHGVTQASIEDITRQSDAIGLLVPAGSLEVASRALVEQGISKDTLIFEMCSAKEYTRGIFERFFKPLGVEILRCHPVFGPESAKDGIRGHKMVVTEYTGAKAAHLLGVWEKAGVEIIEMTDKDHDMYMVDEQVVPFAFGHIANQLLIRGNDPAQKHEIHTPGGEHVRRLGWLDAKHSLALTKTILGYNRHAWPVLEKISDRLSPELLTEISRAQNDVKRQDAILAENGRN